MKKNYALIYVNMIQICLDNLNRDLYVLKQLFCHLFEFYFYN